jgi:mono/diheme cytochrome c family protein
MKLTRPYSLLPAALLASALGAAGAQKTASAATKPGAKPAAPAAGVYTAAQATRGLQVFRNTCSRCHTVAQYSGGAFEAAWGKRRVFDLYEVLTNTMPQDDPGGLSTQEYVDVIAYMLKLNGLPSGTKALSADPAAMKQIRIEIPKKP